MRRVTSMQNVSGIPGSTVLVAFGLAADRTGRQPWHSVDGIARGLLECGERVTVVTDSDDVPGDRPYEIASVRRLFRHGRATAELLGLVLALDPQRVIVLSGPCALALMRHPRWRAETLLLMASPCLRMAEILAAGPGPVWRERRQTLRPLLDSLIPGFVLTAGYRRSGASAIIYLSRSSQSRFFARGLPLGKHVRPQATPFPRNGAGTAGHGPPVICYLGPPLAARGAILALSAFETACGDGLDARLLLLLRPDCGRAVMEDFLDRVERSPFAGRIHCHVGMLSQRDLRRAVSGVDIFLLPFLAPISDVPLVVLEAGLAGRTVVTLDTPGVSEYAADLGGIVVRDPKMLPEALFHAIRSPSPPPSSLNLSNWRGWRAEAEKLPPARPRVIHDLAMIALCGADGTGKSFLLGHLADELSARGIATVHVWSRFRNYLSRPLLALARLTGHNRRERTGATVTGYHDFARTPWLAWPFLLLQIIDNRIDLALRYRSRGSRLVLADRCIFDTLVDLCIDTGLDDLILDRLGPRLVARLPSPFLAVLVRRHPEAVARDRPDALADRNYARRRQLYDRMAERFGLAVIDNQGPPIRSVHEILDLAGVGGTFFKGNLRDLRLLQQ
ncbi:MAG: glycosyltransferase [Geminicoccaceae bacterium]|nr:glycosyltransferase [Geminicoccaceae bacterium]